MQRPRTEPVTWAEGLSQVVEPQGAHRGGWGACTPASLHSHFLPLSPIGHVQLEVQEDTHSCTSLRFHLSGRGQGLGKGGERTCRDTWTMLNWHRRQVYCHKKAVPRVKHGFLCLPSFLHVLVSHSLKWENYNNNNKIAPTNQPFGDK